MSAAEIIKLIKQLPPEERAAVVAFVQSEAGRVAESEARYAAADRPAEQNVRFVAQSDFEKVLPEIFEKHHELFRRLSQ